VETKCQECHYLVLYASIEGESGDQGACIYFAIFLTYIASLLLTAMLATCVQLTLFSPY